MSNGKKLACLITGVPRGFARCLPSLKHLLDASEVDYFAVLRQEFVSAELMAQLEVLLPGIKAIVVPMEDSDWAVSSYADVPIRPKPTLVQMWHEVGYAVESIADLQSYDYVFRTRFDVYFAPQFLPDAEIPEDVVLLPERFFWSGSNDMLCLSRPAAFVKYAKVFNNFPTFVARRNRIPEQILAQSLYLEGLVERPLDVSFLLFRDYVHTEFDDAALDVLCFTPLGCQVFRSGQKLPPPAVTDRIKTEIAEAVDIERRFPVFESPYMANLFPTAKIDRRDKTVFRYTNTHFYMRRALKDVCGMRFKVHYMARGWTPNRLRVTVDGVNVEMSITEVDQFGRPTLYGAFDPLPRFQRPWSKIGIIVGGSRRYFLGGKWAIWKVFQPAILGIGLPEFEILASPQSDVYATKVFHPCVAPVTVSLDRFRSVWRKLVLRLWGRSVLWARD